MWYEGALVHWWLMALGWAMGVWTAFVLLFLLTGERVRSDTEGKGV